MTIADISKHAMTIKPLGCWLMTLIIVEGGTLNINSNDLATLCGVSPATLKSTRRRLIDVGILRYQTGRNWHTDTYEVAS